ncbi:glycosyl hydrolase family 18 protein [Solirubrobacter soli]|uniref:glycosyl hydrolase family 18 protein n=1 Tax=Solirubrobacter soli TaxID=363832 RepID=UPI000480D14A|nr:glycosyl hydrolase family 18 protein [Solirubrobacter soli]
MRRSRIVGLAVAGLLLAAPAQAEAASACAGLKPTSLKAKADAAGTSVTLTWKAKRDKRTAWRVVRDGKTVGQTRTLKMRVRLKPGRKHTLRVTAYVGGRATKCRASYVVAAAKAARTGLPSAVSALSATPVGADQLRIAWGAAEAGGSPIAGYRVLRDGRVVGQVNALSTMVKIAPARSYTIQVAAAGRDGKLGPLSTTVTVAAGHVGPTAPLAPAIADVTDTSATLSWGASTTSDNATMSYRVLRDGKVAQTARGLSSAVKNLVSARKVALSVQAVDSYGWTSPVSEEISFVTGHTPPGVPGTPAADSVGDTRLHLGWGAASVPAGTALRGYRLLRDGVVVSQGASPDAWVGNLAPLATHTWTVAAVDTLGYTSPASAPVTVKQAAPPAAAGSAQTFLLASTDASFAAFQKHYTQIGVVYPTYYDCDITNAAWIGRNDPLVTSWAQARQVKVLPRVNCQNTAINHRILTEPALRAQWLDTIVGVVRDNGYDGINIDFEAVAAADRNALTSFMTELSSRLHAMGKLVSQAVSAKVKDVLNHPRSTAFDYAALSQQVDWVFVMAWGIKYASSTPGAQDDIRWVKQVADYVATMPLKSKFVMGTMLYAMDWPAGGGPQHLASAWHFGELTDLASRYGATPVYDAAQDSMHLAYTDAGGVPHDVYYSDAALVEHRMELARARGLGVGFWRVGQEDERLWSSALLQ